MTGTDDTETTKGKGTVVAFPEKPKPAAQRKATVIYPPALKAHYLDLLLKYKADRSAKLGKPVGWQTIRDEIMREEDAKLAKRVAERDRVDVKEDRPRSNDLTLFDFKGWYDPQKSHFPSDAKFKYIDRFIRSLRLQGEIHHIELDAAKARREYLRDALFTFYRPDLAYADQDRSAWEPHVSKFLDHSVFVAYCSLEEQTAATSRYLLILVCDDFKNGIAPVDVLISFLPPDIQPETQFDTPVVSIALDALQRYDIQSSRVLKLYSGFFVTEKFSPGATSATATLTNPSQADFGLLGLPTPPPRHYNPRIHFIAPAQEPELSNHEQVTSAISWGTSYDDLFKRLGLEIIAQAGTTRWLDGPTSAPIKGFVKLEKTNPHHDTILAIHRKFALGYGPC